MSRDVGQGRCPTCGHLLKTTNAVTGAEIKAARSLGISGDEFRRRCQALYHRRFVAERDARGVGLNAQGRGWVARKMLREIAEGVTRQPPG